MRISLPLAVAALTGPLMAQNSLVVSPDVSFVLQNNVAPAALGFVDDQESIITTPSTMTGYVAQPFRTFTTINVMHGDGDNNADLADLDRYGDCNCLMIRHRPPHAETGPFGPGDLWMAHSFNTTAAVATSSGIVSLKDADIYRAQQGKVEFFVREDVLVQAMPGAPVGGDFDIDGMVQDTQGNLFFSTWNASETFGTTTIVDSDLLYIDAADITYDANGFVTAVTPGSMQIVATALDINSMVAASGALDTSGARITAIFDLGALDLDPNGGTWSSPAVPGLTLPNIVFASNTTRHLDNIWSTAGGGQLAVINGKTMGYLTGRADGSVLGIGLLPTQDAINGMAIVPQQSDWIAVDSPQAGFPVSGQFTIEIGRLQPNSAFGLFISGWPNEMPGGWVSGTPFFFQIGGNRFLDIDPITAVALPPLTADADGYVSLTLQAPPFVLPGPDLLLQGAGTPFGTVGLSASATSSITF